MYGMARNECHGMALSGQHLNDERKGHGLAWQGGVWKTVQGKYEYIMVYI
jgi:hypothetical protein